jgi:hypothetical protein
MKNYISGDRMLWKVNGSSIKIVSETSLAEQNVLESKLEGWIKENPQILGEELLIIGRQIQVEDVKDKLDLLAIDKNWNTVVIEIKRGTARGGTDIQSLKYASYISNWTFENLQKLAEEFFKENKKDQTFANALDQFREEETLDYEDVNQNQRIIIVGTEIDDRIKSVARWLIDKNVDIKLVRITPHQDDSTIYINSEAILPQPTIGVVGKPSAKGRPWLEDGKSWHLQKRCNEENAQRLLKLHDMITSTGDVSVSWNQEFYVAFIVSNRNWIGINTFPNQLNLRFHCESNKYEKETLAKRLDISNDLIETEERGTHQRVTIKVRENFNFETSEFKRFVKECYESFLKIV